MSAVGVMFLSALFAFVRRMPASAAYAFGEACGWVAYQIAWVIGRNRIGMINLRLVFGREQFKGQFAQQLQQQNMDLDSYFKLTNTTEEAWKEQTRPQAEERLQRSLILSQVIVDEEITVDAGEIDAEIEEMMAPLGEQSEQLRELFSSPQGKLSISENLLTRRAMEQLKAIARGEDAPKGGQAAEEGVEEEIEEAPDKEAAEEAEESDAKEVRESTADATEESDADEKADTETPEEGGAEESVADTGAQAPESAVAAEEPAVEEASEGTAEAAEPVDADQGADADTAAGPEAVEATADEDTDAETA